MLRIDEEPMEADVLIAGGGIGGLMAAISAAASGASVIVAEKANTNRSGCGATGNDHFMCYLPEVHGKDMAPILREYQNSQVGGFSDTSLAIRFLEQSFDRVKSWDSWGISMRPRGPLGFFRPRLSGPSARLAQICRAQSERGPDPAGEETRGPHRKPTC